MATEAAPAIDENLQSRQLAVYGKQAFGKLSTAVVLISGLNGLGVEIAKNVILANVSTVVLHDTELTSWMDLSAQFYLTEADVGVNRATACSKQLKELNPMVKVEVSESPITEDFLKRFTSVVFVNQKEDQLIRWNAFCRSQSSAISFIKTGVNGLFGHVFTDFGDSFVVQDTNGEQARTAIVASIGHGSPAVVHCIDDERIDFEDGNSVVFTEVQGMTELNDREFKIANVKAHSFEIEDTTNFGQYKSGGIVTEVKQHKTLNFKPLSVALASPGEFLESDFSKFGRSAILHAVMRALDEFASAHDQQLPTPGNDDHFKEVFELASKHNEALGDLKGELDEGLLKKLVFGARSVLNPLAAIFGGIVGQEVIKASTAKFHPIFQWLYMDAVECLPDNWPLPAEEYAAQSTRYDAQIQVFGKTMQQKMADLKLFLVGAGALGCEFIKNFAMIGVATSATGQVVVTDDDTIERSNLTRQFLFRNWMIGKSKSAAAAETIKSMNPDFKLKALQDRVSPQTENIFNTQFWTQLDCVVNALDNVKARLYVDSRCVFFNKSLLESGTLGTKCNTQVVIPHKTENYGASQDPPEKEAPECTLHNFPHTVNHCLTWARSEFIGNFETIPSEVNTLLKAGPAYLKEQRDAGQKPQDILHNLTCTKELLITERCTTFDDCVAWARRKFEDYFANRIKQLTYNFPQTATTSTGAPFWSPPKRFPTPLVFDANDSEHMNFVVAAANLRAVILNIRAPAGHRDTEFFKSILATVHVPEFVPKANFKIKVDEKENIPQEIPDDENIDKSFQELSEFFEKHKVEALNPQEFEKDVDTNFHMDFISAVGNLRARAYAIKEVDKLQAKLIAGKIIPAIATTTAVATGFVCLEFYKLVNNKPFEAYRNTFANLALPLFALSEPMPPSKVTSRVVKSVPDPINHPEYVEEEEIKALPEGHTVWDRIDVEIGDATLEQFIQYFKDKFGISATSVSVGTSTGAVLIYNNFIARTKSRLPEKLTTLYTTLSNQSIEGSYLLPICLFVDAEGVSVETPTIVFHLPRS